MSDTRLISMRIPCELLAEIDAQAEREQRSRAKVIILRLSGRGVDGHASTERDAGSIPAVPAGRSLTVKPLRDSQRLGGVADRSPAEQVSSPAAPTDQEGKSQGGAHRKGSEIATASTKCPNRDHSGFQRNDGYWCTTCRRMY